MHFPQGYRAAGDELLPKNCKFFAALQLTNEVLTYDIAELELSAKTISQVGRLDSRGLQSIYFYFQQIDIVSHHR